MASAVLAGSRLQGELVKLFKNWQHNQISAVEALCVALQMSEAPLYVLPSRLSKRSYRTFHIARVDLHTSRLKSFQEPSSLFLLLLRWMST